MHWHTRAAIFNATSENFKQNFGLGSGGVGRVKVGDRERVGVSFDKVGKGYIREDKNYIKYIYIHI